MKTTFGTASIHGSLLVVLLALSYSLFGVLSRLSFPEMGTFEQVGVRSGVAFMLTLPFINDWRFALRLSRRDWGLLLFRGILMYAISIPCFIQAVNTGYLGIVSLIAALPFSSVFGVVLYRERTKPTFWVGLTVAMLGLLPLVHDPLAASTYCIVMAAVSSVTFALALVLRRSQSEAVSDAQGNLALLSIGVLASAVGARATGEALPSLLNTSFLLNLAGGVLVAVNAYIASAAFRLVPATRAGSILMLEPVISGALGAWLFSEAIGLQQGVGALVVLGGILFASIEWKLRMRPASERRPIRYSRLLIRLALIPRQRAGQCR